MSQAIDTPITAEDKRLSSLRAIAALAGVRVDPIETDAGHRAWIVTRWNLTKQVNSTEELTTFLQAMGIST